MNIKDIKRLSRMRNKIPKSTKIIKSKKYKKPKYKEDYRNVV